MQNEINENKAEEAVIKDKQIEKENADYNNLLSSNTRINLINKPYVKKKKTTGEKTITPINNKIYDISNKTVPTKNIKKESEDIFPLSSSVIDPNKDKDIEKKEDDIFQTLYKELKKDIKQNNTEKLQKEKKIKEINDNKKSQWLDHLKDIDTYQNDVKDQ